MKKRVVSVLLCLVICISLIPSTAFAVSARDTAFEERLAVDLKGLGLFKGVSDTDFDLNREPSRLEAMVMLIRVLGKEKEALNGSWKHPFTDVAPWADKYVGYAYSNGLTKGVSATEFGTGTASSYMYLTFVLRALGYSDTNGADFTWDNPYGLAKTVGILPDFVNTTVFWRADVVVISYAALPVALKGTTQTLAQKLIASGAFTQAQFNTYYDGSAIGNHQKELTSAKKELTAKEIYAQCAPAVFYIETFDVEGNPYAFGSGFFIDGSGIAVTNHHMLKNALSAKVTLTNGKQYDVSGVLVFDDELDYAIIKVNGTGFTSLKVGNSSELAGGETIYTIGNPQGLTSTISDGIVSNPNRADLNGMIQITAPISAGSSGGALINNYGEVVGVTTAMITSGQNLNFAVPINDVMPREDITKYESVHGILSLAKYAERNEYLTYANIPEPYEYYVYETEPNDTLDYANEIDNGTSVYGVIDDGYCDTFILHCNTTGTIEVSLISDSMPKYVKDLIVKIEPVNKTGSEGVTSDYQTFEDGTSGRFARYAIPRAGTYVIYIVSSNLYKTEYLYTDYSFYYTFTPGSVTGANTTGSSTGGTTGGTATGTRQQSAYQALKNWVNKNSNTTLDGDKAYLLSYAQSDDYTVEQGVVYDADADIINLVYNIYYYGDKFVLYLNLTDEGASFVSCFTYYSQSVKNPTFTGYASINPLTFSPVMTLSFYQVSGDTRQKSEYAELAVAMISGVLSYTDSLFKYLVDDSYSMGDFGFTGR